MRLLAIARRSVGHGLEFGRPLQAGIADLAGPLGEVGASFVTLTQSGQLRGCVGSVEARRPLAQDVAHSAFGAAFDDPRFPRITGNELHETRFEISVLSAPCEVPGKTEAEVLAALVPGEDGLLLDDGPLRATFLPKVWEMLPEPADFLRELRKKAGLPGDHWSATLRIRRYSAMAFGEGD